MNVIVFTSSDLLPQPWIDANGLSRKNVSRHAGVLFADFDAASKSAIFANVTVPRFSGALRATGGIVRLGGLFFRVGKRRFQCIIVVDIALALALARLNLVGLIGLIGLVGLIGLIGSARFQRLLKHVNAAGCGSGRNVDRGFGALRRDIHRGLRGVRRRVAHPPSHRAERCSKRVAEPSRNVI